MPKSKGSYHINDILEWEKKQYTPWEYAQEGKLPLFLKAKGNKKLAAILFYVQGGICVLFFFLVIFSSSNLDEAWTELLVLAAYASLCFIVAANYLKKWKTVKLLKEKRKATRKK